MSLPPRPADPSRRRLGLVWRVVLLLVLGCVVTAAIGLGISTALISGTTNSTARTRLAHLADLAAAGAGTVDRSQSRAVLASLRIHVAVVGPAGRVTSGNADATAATTPAVVAAVLAGSSVSSSTTVNGHQVLVEARPAAGGGVVLVERHADAVSAGTGDLYRTLWALSIAVVVTVVIGILVIRRVLRPLRATADAARALAAGRRDVHVPTDAPPEIAEVATALNGLTGALVRSEGRQREFLTSVSHDLRTPLTAIVGYAESLRTGVVTGEAAQEFVVGIEDEAHRLERMVADLLDLARLQAEDVRVEIVPVELGEALRGCGRAWAPRALAAGLDVDVRTPGVPVWAPTDPGRLRQMLDCLLDNAVRVCPPGRPVVLQVFPGQAPWAAVVEVRDGGPGLSPADLQVAFERGALHERYRGERPVGTGLGLAVVRRLADRLGIALEAGHAVEGGARFTLLVPGFAPPTGI